MHDTISIIQHRRKQTNKHGNKSALISRGNVTLELEGA